MEISYFLHGLALQDELKNLMSSKQKKAKTYISNIKRLGAYADPITEIALSWVDFDLIENVANEAGGVRVVHAPFVQGDFPGQITGQQDFVDITNYSIETKNKLVTLIKNLSKLKKKHEPLTLIFHPLPYKELIEPDKIIENMQKLFSSVCDLLIDNNIYLTIENMPVFSGVHSYYNGVFTDVDFFQKFFDVCKCKNVGMTFDFGHANTVARYNWLSGVYDNNALRDFYFQNTFLNKVGNRVKHVHFHYNPAHLPDYNIGLLKYIPKLKNLDFHDQVGKYTKRDWVNISKVLDNVRNNQDLTVTLEVLPRTLDSFNAYLADVNKFSNNIVIQYEQK